MIKLNWLAAGVFLRESVIVLAINHYIHAVGLEFANRPANRRQARSEDQQETA
jgi:hypothetical protein